MHSFKNFLNYNFEYQIFSFKFLVNLKYNKIIKLLDSKTKLYLLTNDENILVTQNKINKY